MQSSYLFTALTLINKIPQLNDEIKAMMWQGQTVLDRLTTELNERYCHLAKQQLLQLLTRCRSEVNIRSNNSHNSKSIELRRLYQAISSRHFDEEHIGATKLAAFVTLAMRLIRHKRQLTESKTYQRHASGFENIHTLLRSRFPVIAIRAELYYPHAGCHHLFDRDKPVTFALHQQYGPAIYNAIDRITIGFNGQIAINWESEQDHQITLQR